MFGVLLIITLSVGTFVRIYPSEKITQIGYDEGLYERYSLELSHAGVLNYPLIVERYLEAQGKRPIAMLPPTRFLYILCGTLVHESTGLNALASLRCVSCTFSIMLMLLSFLFTTRLAGAIKGLCVAALVACAPTQIHMAQHALIDGFFAFWATLSLWLLWETLQRPRQWPWLACYTGSLAMLVLTKENALFAYAGIVVLLVTNHWFRFGEVTRELLLATLVGPILGVALLVMLCGSVSTLVQVYSILVAKAHVTPYAIITGDGPWYRYLFDLLLVSPVVVILAIGRVFKLQRSDRTDLFMLFFVVMSYCLMANVRYGMNLRYANMWDLPLRYLAVGCLMPAGRLLSRRSLTLLGLAVLAISLIELRQYWILFVRNDLYELITAELLRALGVLKL